MLVYVKNICYMNLYLPYTLREIPVRDDDIWTQRKITLPALYIDGSRGRHPDAPRAALQTEGRPRGCLHVGGLH